MPKEYYAYISLSIAALTTWRYIRLLLQGKVKPHIFTWIIWTTVIAIATAARGVEGSGAGNWAYWFNAVACGLIAFLAWSKGDHDITLSDKIAFAAALSTIPIWLLTNNPLLALIIVTTIDLCGYYPTFRKSFNKPWEEGVFNYVGSNAIHILAILATDVYSFATMLTPVALFIANTALIIMLLWRRRALNTHTPSVEIL